MEQISDVERAALASPAVRAAIAAAKAGVPAELRKRPRRRYFSTTPWHPVNCRCPECTTPGPVV